MSRVPSSPGLGPRGPGHPRLLPRTRRRTRRRIGKIRHTSGHTNLYTNERYERGAESCALRIAAEFVALRRPFLQRLEHDLGCVEHVTGLFCAQREISV